MDQATKEVPTQLQRLEEYCHQHDYAGYCKFDALNSRWLERWFGGSTIGRLVVTQLVNRVPLPLRSWFGVPKVRNPKGIANFIRGYVTLYQQEKNPLYKERAIVLAEWLLRRESHELGAYEGPGKAWGYHFPWQSPGFFAPRFSPNCIVSCFVGEAMLSVFELTGKRKFLDAAMGVRDYILTGLPNLIENDRERCVGYVQHGLRWRVININAVAAGFLARLAVRTADRELAHTAGKMIHWVCERRNRDFTWDYTSPKEQSGIGPDNYHTGGIIDGIFEYMMHTGDQRFMGIYRQSLAAYQNLFFTDEGAPKWRINRPYPYDVHGSAQGVMTFSRAATLDIQYSAVAGRILDWALNNLCDSKTGRFYYRKTELFTWKMDLMRWNNSWMFRAMAEHAEMSLGRTYPPPPPRLWRWDRSAPSLENTGFFQDEPAPERTA